MSWRAARSDAGSMSWRAARSDAGSMSLEVVLVVPVLMLLALFVLWAGRGGRAALMADLAAEEAATAAAVACEDGDPAGCEGFVADVLSARPGMDFLCIGGPRRDGDAPLVERRELDFAAAGDGLSQLPQARGAAVVGVRFVCETDGAVAPLQGVFPTVVFRGQASEVAILQGAPRAGVADAEVTEGADLDDDGKLDPLVFTVTLDSPAVGDVEFDYEVAPVTDHTGEPGDYILDAYRRVTIRDGNIRAEIEVRVVDDDLHEATERLELTLVVVDPTPDIDDDPLPAVFEDGEASATAEGTILDDDDPSAATVTADPASVREGSATHMVFVVEIGPIGLDVLLSFNTTDDGTARGGPAGTGCPAPNLVDPIDFTPASDSHTFTASDEASTHEVRVPLCDDVIGEPDETVTLEWSSQPAGYGSGTAEVTIEDDEPELSVGDARACEAADPNDCGDPGIGGGRLTFTVQRWVPPGETPAAVTVRYRTRPVNPDDSVSHVALPIHDYTPVPGDDCPADSHRLEIPAGATDRATVTPVSGTPRDITAVSTTSSEGTNTTVEVDVVLIDDELDEHDDETLWLELCDPSDSAWLEDGWGRGTIVDDDDPPTLTTPDAGPATEGGLLQFDVILDAPSGRVVSVDYWTEDGSATAAEDDYTAVPQTPRTTLTFPVDAATGATDASMMSQTAEIIVLADDLYEPDTDPATPDPHTETVALRFHPSNAVAAAAADPCPAEAADDPSTTEDEAAQSRQDDCAVGTITDADTPPELTVDDDCTLTGAPAAARGCAAEGDGVAFTLALDKTSSQPLEVAWTVAVDAGAVLGDFVGPPPALQRLPSGTATILAGARGADISVATFDDAFDEEDFEEFTLELSVSAGDAAVAAGHGASVGAVADNDDFAIVEFVSGVFVGPGCVQPGEACAVEGVHGAMVLEVRLVDGGGAPTRSERDVVVGYFTREQLSGDRRATGGASESAAGADYLSVAPGTATVTIPPGTVDGSRASFGVEVFDDGRDEPDVETLLVSLETVDGGFARLHNRRAVEASIVDDDTAELRFVDNCESGDGDAGDSGDGDGGAWLACTVEGDTDGDGGAMVFGLELGAALADDAAVCYRTGLNPSAGIAAAAAGDFAAAPAADTSTDPDCPDWDKVVIGAGDTTAQITIDAAGDDTFELDETLLVQLSAPAGAQFTLGSPHIAVGAIIDDDDPPRVRVSADGCTLGGAPAAARGCAAEGSAVVFRAELVEADDPEDPDDTAEDAATTTSHGDITLAWTVAVDAGAVLGDFVGPPPAPQRLPSGTATILAGARGADISVGTLDDAFDEDDFEEFTLNLSVSQGDAAVAAGHGASVGAIADNDDFAIVEFVSGVFVGPGCEQPGEACATEGVHGAMVLEVRLVDGDGAPTRSERDVVVGYFTRELSGDRRATGGASESAAGADYLSVAPGTATVEIPPGTVAGSRASFGVEIFDDGRDEADVETLLVSLEAVPGGFARLHDRRVVEASIVDDDTAELRFVDNCESGDGDSGDSGGGDGGAWLACAVEGDGDPGGAMVFGLELGAALADDAAVCYRTGLNPSAGIAAAAAGDFAAAPAADTSTDPDCPDWDKVVIGAGDTTAQITIDAAGDDTFELDETLLVHLRAPAGAQFTLGSPHIAVGAIIDDDDPPRVRVSADGCTLAGAPAAARGCAAEGSAVVFRAELVEADDPQDPDDTAEDAATTTSHGDITLAWTVAVDAGAVLGDFVGPPPAPQRLPSGTATILAGARGADISVGTLDDAFDEDDFEEFTLNLSVSQGDAAVAAGHGASVGAVADNDDFAIVEFVSGVFVGPDCVQPGEACATEGVHGAMVLEVRLVDGGGAPTRSERDVVVGYFTREQLSGDRRATGGASESAAGADYLSVAPGTATVEIPPGTVAGSRASFGVEIFDDGRDEADVETLLVSLEAVPGGFARLHDRRVVEASIVDDDTAELRFVDNCESGDGDSGDSGGGDGGAWLACAVEGDGDPGGAMVFGLELGAALADDAAVCYRTGLNPSAGIAAAAAGDFAAAPAADTSTDPDCPDWDKVVIGAGDTTAQITIDAAGDDTFELDETLLVHLRAPAGAQFTLGSPHIAVGAIIDDDDPPRVRVSADGCTLAGAPAAARGCAAEGSAVVFRAELVEADDPQDPDDTAEDAATTTSHGDITLAWTVAVDAGAVLGDFVGPPPAPQRLPSGTATILAGARGADISVGTLDDAFDEDDFEEFTLNLSVSQGDAAVAAGHGASVGAVADNDPMPRVALLGSPRQSEGNALVFTVALVDNIFGFRTPSGRTVTVQYYTSGGTATGGGACSHDPAPDYVAVAQSSALTVEFDPADADPATETLEIATCDDGVDEDDDSSNSDDETVQVSLQSATNARIAAVGATGTGRIGDNDRVNVSVGDGNPDDSDDDAETAEGNPLIFEVSLDKPSDRQVLVDYHTHSGGGSLTADPGADYVAVPRTPATTLTFEPGERAKPVTVNTETDDEAESEERMQLRLANPRTDPTTAPTPADAYLGNEIAVGVIRDECLDPGDDDATVPELTAVNDSIEVREGRAGVFTVTAGAPLCRDPHLYYQVAAGPHTAGRFDAVPLAGARTPGAANDSHTSWTFRVQTYSDDVHEGDETFTVEVSWDLPRFESPPPEGYEPLADQFRSAAPLAVTVKIIDDDEPPLLSVSDGGPAGAGSPRPVEEGSPVEFVVRLDRPSALPVSFDYYTFSGTGSLTAVAGTDYTQVQPTPATIDATATDATATLSGLRVTHFVQPGTRTVAVETLQEAPPEPEGVERFQLVLQDWENAREGDDTGTGEIRDACTDPDTDTGPVPTLTIQDARHDEGAGAPLVQVGLRAPLCRSVSVSYSMFGDHDDPGAHYAGPEDFRGSQGRGSAPAGVLSFNLPARLAIVDDSLDEHDEAVPIWVEWDSGGADAAPARWAAAAREEGAVTIVDNDPQPRLRVADAVATGGAPLSFAVDLVDAGDRPVVSGRDVSVQYRTAPNPSAGAGAAQPGASCDGTADFVSLTGQPPLRITAGTDTSADPATITVQTCTDRPDPTDKTLLLELDTSTAENAGIRDGTALGTIGADCIDTAQTGHLMPTVTASDARVVENAGPASVMFELDRPFCADTTPFTFTTVPGTATHTDYRSATGVFPIAADQTGFGTTVEIIDDAPYETDETFRVRLGYAAGFEYLAQQTPEADLPAAVVTIVDDAQPSLLRIHDTSIVEEGTAVFTVELVDSVSDSSVEAGADVSVDYYTTRNPSAGDAAAEPGSACTGTADFVSARGTAEIRTGRASTQISVTTCDDDRSEGDETFLLRLDGRTAANAGIDIGTAEGTILDDDRDCVRFGVGSQDPPAVEMRSPSAEEGAAVVFEAVLDAPFCEDVASAVTWRIDLVSAEESDFAGPVSPGRAQTLPLAAGQSILRLVFGTVDDTLAEGEETFLVTLDWHGSMPDDYQYPEPVVATGTILDNDGDCIDPADPDHDVPLLSTAHRVGTPENDGTIPITIFAAAQFCADAVAEAAYRTGPSNSRWVVFRATAGLDYEAASGTVDLTQGTFGGFGGPGLFFGGRTHLEVPITIIDDDIPERDESFRVFVEWAPSMPERYRAQNEDLIEYAAHPSILDDDDCIDPSEVVPDRTSDFLQLRLGNPDGTDTPARSVVEGQQWIVFVRPAARFCEQVDDAVEVRYSTDASSLGLTSRPITAEAADFDPPSDGRTLASAPIGGGITEAQAVLAIADDSEVEGDETFYVDIRWGSGMPESWRDYFLESTYGVRWRVQVRIIDDEYPEVSVEDVTAGEDEGTLDFTLTLDPAPVEDAAVDWSTASPLDAAVPAATPNIDYTAASGTANFDAGTTQATVSVELIDDDRPEPDETFRLVLANPDKLQLGDDTDAAGTITDDDGGCIAIDDDTDDPPEWSAAAGLVPGSAGAVYGTAVEGRSMRFGIVLDEPLCDDGWYTVEARTGTGTAGAGDYVLDASLGVGNWLPAGETLDEFTVRAVDDTVIEADETFELVVRWHADRMPSHYHDDEQLDLTGTIIDDDFPSASVADADAAEADGTLVFTITLDHPAAQPATVKYHTDERPSEGDRAATRDIDYTHTTGSADFSAGDSTATVAVPIAADTTDEPDETFLLKLSDPEGLNLVDREAVGTIRDLATVSLHDARITEGELLAMYYHLDRAYSLGRPGEDAKVTMALDTGEATTATACVAGSVADCDGYFGLCGYSLAPHNNSTSFGCGSRLSIDDDLYEGDEQIAYRLENVTGLWLGDVDGVLTIVDNEAVPQLSAGADLAVAEGRSLTFAVTLTGPARERSATVDYATEDDTATSGGACTIGGPDYVTAEGTLTFLPGTDTATVTVTTCPNAGAGGDREFVLRLSNPTGAVIADGRDSARGRIWDDDAPVVTVGDASAVEGSPIEFPVTLSAATSVEVRVHYGTVINHHLLTFTGVPSALTGGGDWVTIAPGETSATITVATVDNDLQESDRIFPLWVREATNARIGAHTFRYAGAEMAEGIIIDNDDGPLPELTVEAAEAREDGGSMQFDLRLSEAAAQDVTVQYTTVGVWDGPAAQPGRDVANYVREERVVIPAGHTSAPLLITIFDDDLDEPNEDFFVWLSRLRGAVFDGNRVRGTIIDND